MFSRTSLLVLVIINVTLAAFPNVYKQARSSVECCDDDPGVPLILTPLIEQGKLKEALAAATVNFNGFKGVKSYSAYLTVNKQFNSNLFFWFFPAEEDYANAPVVVWLQGGPGASSLIGLFTENGPFEAKSKHGVKSRKFSWTKNHSVIYIDNPVGAGFSFTDDNGYARNETQVGEELYEALTQFFTLFPELQKNDFFVTGESYGGKYVPAISYTILQKNQAGAKLQINLQGLSIGNGLCDPIHQFEYADYLYQIGLIDLNSREEFKKIQQEAINFIKNKQFDKAFEVFDNLLDGDLTNQTSLFRNKTGFVTYFNYLYSEDVTHKIDYMTKYVSRADVRAAIHVGNRSFSDENSKVEINLKSDVMDSVAPWISELLNHYRVLIYNGQLDIIVAYPLTLNFLQNLNFNGADEYKTAPRYQWIVDQQIAGYVKQAGNLTEVLVRDAGHMVPTDQPQWAFDLITRFTRNKPFH